jgi:hypothetical protein
MTIINFLLFNLETFQGDSKMPKKKAIDGKKLIKMVKDEIPQPEIMKTFDFKTSTQLKTSYMNALIEVGEVPAIVSGRGTAKATTSNEVNVGKRGSLIIPKGLVEDLGFVENDKFLVKKTKTGISLKKLY